MHVITVLTGENSYLLKVELSQLIDSFVAEHTDMGLERLDGEEAEYGRMQEAVESIPFLASKKLVVLQRPSANKEFIEKAASLLEAVPDTTDVVIVEPKPDKRTVYYKLLKKVATVKEFAELDENGLARWLVEQAKQREGSLSLADARYLVQRVGVNQRLMSNELDKLLSYAPDITRQTIDLLTEPTPQSTVFELLDAAMAGNAKRALELYGEQRAMKVEPQQILAMLAWQLHALAVVKTAAGKDAATIAKEAKINPYAVRKTQNLARQMSVAQIKRLVQSALELDIRLKSQPIDADEALTNLLLTIK